MDDADDVRDADEYENASENERALREGFTRGRVVWFGARDDWRGARAKNAHTSTCGGRVRARRRDGAAKKCGRAAATARKKKTGRIRGRWQDWVFYVENQHTLVSMWRGHAMHPFERFDRVCYFLCVVCFSLFLSAFARPRGKLSRRGRGGGAAAGGARLGRGRSRRFDGSGTEISWTRRGDAERVPRGYSVEASRGDAAGATWILRGGAAAAPRPFGGSRRRLGRLTGRGPRLFDESRRAIQKPTAGTSRTRTRRTTASRSTACGSASRPRCWCSMMSSSNSSPRRRACSPAGRCTARAGCAARAASTRASRASTSCRCVRWGF